MEDMRANTAPMKVGFIHPFYCCLLEELKTINGICSKADKIKLFIQCDNGIPRVKRPVNIDALNRKERTK